MIATSITSRFLSTPTVPGVVRASAVVVSFAQPLSEINRKVLVLVLKAPAFDHPLNSYGLLYRDVT